MKVIDPAKGWRYGFPKELPEDVEDIQQWLLDQGYPEENINLPYRIYETNFYKLTKTFIDEGATSNVWVGANVSGDLYRVTEYATPNEEITPDDIEEGDEILVEAGLRDWIKTSKIKRVVKNSDVSWYIKTQTSSYELERV